MHLLGLFSMILAANMGNPGVKVGRRNYYEWITGEVLFQGRAEWLGGYWSATIPSDTLSFLPKYISCSS